MDVILFLSNQLSIPVEKIGLEESLFHDLGVDGGDAFELIEAYGLRFNVDIKEFKFDEYFGPEGSPTPWGFVLEWFKKQSKKKRLTVSDLVRGVDSGKLI